MKHLDLTIRDSRGAAVLQLADELGLNRSQLMDEALSKPPAHRPAFDLEHIHWMTSYHSKRRPWSWARICAASLTRRRSKPTAGSWILHAEHGLGLFAGHLKIARRKASQVSLPVALIGRLAVDERAQGKRLAEKLWIDALCGIADASEIVGCVGAIVDAKNDGADRSRALRIDLLGERRL